MLFCRQSASGWFAPRTILRRCLAVALAEAAIVGGVGATIELPFPATLGHLFGEAQSRVIVTVAPDDAEQFEREMASAGRAMVSAGYDGG